MVEQSRDALTPEATPPLRALPRRVQVVIALVLVVAIVLGIVLFDRENGGSVTNLAASLPQVGDHLAALQLTDANGSPFDMAMIEGHPVWINIWATWCPGCRAEMPDLEVFYQQARLTHPDFMLLSLNTADTRERGLKFFRESNLTSTPVFNDGSNNIGPYRIHNFPTNILVDRNGIVRRVLQSQVNQNTVVQESRIILN